MLIAALLLALPYDPPGLDQKVSIDAKGVTGKELSEELTRKTGIRFETMDEATADRYIVHIENAPLMDAMQRIAEAETGEWLRLGENAYRLRRSPVKAAAARAKAKAETIRKFTKVLDSYRKQLGAVPDFSDDAAQKLAKEWRHLGPPPNNGGMDFSGYWERQNKLERAIPVGRAFMRVLVTFTPEELAELPIDLKTVYSTSPTAMQHAMSNAALDGLNTMIQEQIVWEDAVAKYLPEQANQGWNGMATSGHIRNVTNAMITFTRWDENSGVQAQLILSDKKGHIVTETYLFVDEQYEPPKKDANAPPPPKPEPDVPLSALDSAFASVFGYNNWDGRAKAPEASDEMKAIAADPEKYDPLSTFISDSLIGIAGQRHENVAAVLDERSLYWFASSVTKKGINPRTIDNMARSSDQIVDEGSGWLVLSLKQPDRADQVRCDRHALRLMLDSARAQGRLTLDDAATFSLSSERFNESPIPQAYLTLFLDKQGARTLQENDKNLLRFYGSLDAGQRSIAEHLPLSRLDGFQISLLEKLVFGSWANLQEEQNDPMQPDEDGQYYGFWNSIEREPTVSLGDGIPRTGYAKITLAKNKAILAHMQYGDWDQGFQTYDAGSLGWMIASWDTQSSGNMPWRVLGMRPADRTQVTFEFKYTEKISQQLTLQDVLPTAGETNFVEKLPDDLRRELQKSIDEARKQYAEGNGPMYYGGFGGVNSAPPL